MGYETVMRFTKGNHAFIVATHTDKAHIHNHIIFNSASLDCTHRGVEDVKQKAVHKEAPKVREDKAR